MKTWQLVLAGLLVATTFSFRTSHHGCANYDRTKTPDYPGIVKEITFENPHARAIVKDKN